MRCLIPLLAAAILGLCTGCSGDANKGVNKGLDKPKAPAKTDVPTTPPPAEGK